jgi:uncharacterized membrane protein
MNWHYSLLRIKIACYFIPIKNYFDDELRKVGSAVLFSFGKYHHHSYNYFPLLRAAVVINRHLSFRHLMTPLKLAEDYYDLYLSS